MKYKLLALDIDGTIVKEHTNTSTANVIDAIQKARGKIYIVLVSARAWKDQEIIINLLGLKNNYHAIENGTKVVSPSGTVEYNLHIPVSEIQEIIDAASGFFHEVGFCMNGQWVKEYTQSKQDTISTISFISYKRNKAHKIYHAVKQLSNEYSITIGSHWNEPTWAVTLISHKNASKGAGLQYIQEKLNIRPDETIAVGDGASDVSMMQRASVRVAMGNAEPELKKIATHHVRSVSEDGLVEAINQFVFSG